MKKLLERMRSYSFWVSLTGALIIFLNCLGNIFGFKIENAVVENVIMSSAGILVVFGLVTKDTPKNEEETEEDDKNDENSDETIEERVPNEEENNEENNVEEQEDSDEGNSVSESEYEENVEKEDINKVK